MFSEALILTTREHRSHLYSHFSHTQKSIFVMTSCSYATGRESINDKVDLIPKNNLKNKKQESAYNRLFLIIRFSILSYLMMLLWYKISPKWFHQIVVGEYILSPILSLCSPHVQLQLGFGVERKMTLSQDSLK